MSLTWGKQRSGLERRSGFDRRLLTVQQAEMLRCCQLARVFYVGIQAGFAPVPDLLLFQIERGKSTLSLPVSEVTPLRILNRVLDESRKPLPGVLLVMPVQQHLNLFGQL